MTFKKTDMPLTCKFLDFLVQHSFDVSDTYQQVSCNYSFRYLSDMDTTLTLKRSYFIGANKCCVIIYFGGQYMQVRIFFSQFSFFPL